LCVIYFRSLKDLHYVATLVNYTAHPLTVGDTSTLITADYPGVLKQEIEESLGGIALFINGACGDNHPLGAEAGFGRAERMGQMLAEKALYHRWDSVPVDVSTLGCAYEDVMLPPMTDQDYKRIPANFNVPHRKMRDEYLVDGQIKTSFNIWSVGPIAFMGVPGELSAELGAHIKWESSFTKSFVMFLSTDHIGYISHKNAYAWGGYEVISSPFGPDAGAILVSKILKRADSLKDEIESRGPKLDFPGQRQ